MKYPYESIFKTTNSTIDVWVEYSVAEATELLIH